MRRSRGGVISGVWGPSHPRWADLWAGGASSLLRRGLARRGIFDTRSEYAASRLADLRRQVQEGREAFVLGLGVGLHNAGAALIRVSSQGTVELLCNEEEERYTAVKHCSDYPQHSLEAVRRRMDGLGIGAEDLVACVGSWDYAKVLATFLPRPIAEEGLTGLIGLTRERPEEVFNGAIARLMWTSADRLGGQLGAAGRQPIVGMRHHDCHAYFSYAASPFAAGDDPTMVIVLDGSGDDASASLYEARQGCLRLLSTQGTNPMDSLGTFYGVLSSTQGGWPMLSSEGRYMGAAAWGNRNRLTNRYYRRLRQVLHFGSEGTVHTNRALANWTKGGFTKPYSEELREILGEPISLSEMWNPDAILSLEDIRHPDLTRERLDRAAAVQMVFEDALVHVVDHLIRSTGSNRLVLAGGTALNCVANMHLLDCFDEEWYARELGHEDACLNLWVPPTPGDAGTPVGAAYAFAMQAGARPGPPLRHAFHCGFAPTSEEIRAAVRSEPAVASMPLGDCSDPERQRGIAGLIACALAGDRIVGLCQGASETGQRALGHRSILANPCNPDTRRLLNERVKHRELIRPLAPMLTRVAAERFFHLQPGASADDYNAYNYMVLTARARPEAREAIPAVIHHDGTGRLQIVRPETDPFCHELLLAMGRRTGVEALVNTSLNVGAPIAHTAQQAVTTLTRARGMDGLLTIAADGKATLIWLQDRAEARERLLETVRDWVAETGFELPDPLPLEANPS